MFEAARSWHFDDLEDPGERYGYAGDANGFANTGFAVPF